MATISFTMPEDPDFYINDARQVTDMQLQYTRWFVSVRRKSWSYMRGAANYHSGMGHHADTFQEALDGAIKNVREIADVQVRDKMDAAARRDEELVLARAPKAKPSQAELDDFLADLGI